MYALMKDTLYDSLFIIHDFEVCDELENDCELITKGTKAECIETMKLWRLIEDEEID